jgi:hypothetical protein
MYLVQFLLPVPAEPTDPYLASVASVRDELTSQFGGVTAYERSPASGVWAGDDGRVVHDRVVMVEVEVPVLDRRWWSGYRSDLARRFGQEAIMMRAIAVESL